MGYADYVKQKKEGKLTSNKSGGYARYSAEKRLNLDTFDADLAAASDLVNKVYSGWQSADDMKSSYKTVSAMRDRLNAHKSYTNDYSNGQDLTKYNDSMDKLIAAYDTALTDWDALSAEYAKYADADSYGVAKKNAERYNKYKGLDFAGVRKAIEENPDDAEFLSKYGLNVGYENKDDVEHELNMVDYLIETTSGEEKKAWKEYRNRLYEATMVNPNALFKGSEAFADGYQPGDLLDALGATAADAFLRGTKGFLGSMEGLADLGTYGVSKAAGFFGLDGVEDSLKNFAQKNMTQDLYRPLYSTSINEDSFLGGLGHSVGEGVGQMVFNLMTGKMGAGFGKNGAGIASKAGMFASSAGSGMSEAYNSGATDMEALAYGLMSGAVETGSEMMFGGLGKSVNALGLSRGIASLDDQFARKVGSKINNLVLRNAAEMGIKATGEGLEELASGLGSAVAKKFTYMSDEDLMKLIEDEDLLNQFLVGTLSSTVTQSPSLMRSYKYGTDFVTDRTDAEEFYITSEYEARLAEAEKDGKELSNKEKDELYRQVEKDLTTAREEAYNAAKRNAPNAVGRMASVDVTDTVDNETGSKIKVQGIRTDDSGNTVLKTNMGERNLDSVTLNRRDAELVAMAEEMEESRADLFVSMYNGQDATQYKDSFDLAYAYGKNAFGVENAIKRHGVLTESQALQVYKLGVSERTAAPQKKVDAITEKYFSDGGTVKAGTFSDKGVNYNKLNSRQKAAASFAKMFSKATGVNVVLFESKADEKGVRTAENGRYEKSTNTVYIDVYAGFKENEGIFEDSMIPTMSHEITHWMKEKAPEAYAKLSEIVMDTLSRHHNASPEVLVAVEKKNHKKRGRDVSDEYAQDELIARACEDMLSGNKTANEIIEQMDEETAKTFSEKFKEVVAKIRAWLKELLGVYKSGSEEAKILRRYDDKLAELQKAWDEALEKAVRANQAMQNRTEKNAFGLESYTSKEKENWAGGNIIIAEGPEDIANFIRKWNKTGEYKRLYCGKIGEELASRIKSDTGVELTGYNVAIRSDYEDTHADAEKEEGRGQMVITPDVLSLFPTVISEYDKVEVRGTTPTKDNVALVFEKYINGTKISVTYVARKRKMLYLQTMYGWDEKKNPFPAVNTSNDASTTTSETVRDTDSSKDSIPHNSENIKENVQRSDRDSEGNGLTGKQVEFFKDSKARDAHGNLLVLYHQTGEEFTVFDVRHEGAGTRDDGTPFGVFMKTSASDIGLRGNRQMKLYANIVNPLHAENREELEKHLRNMSEEYGRLLDEHKKLDSEYQEKFDLAKKELRNFMIEWRKEHADAGRRELYDVPRFNELYEAEDRIVEEWTMKADEYSVKAKETVTNALRDNGYDGVILARDSGSFGRSTDAYIALDSNQVKYVHNESPTKDSDIRFSDRDSNGNGLTPEQVEFFKDSKVRDENGNLKVMYHGTAEDFTVFEPLSKGGKNGTAEGFGIYFADTKLVSDAYGGKVMTGYLNITRPATSYDKTIKKRELVKLIKATCEAEAKRFVDDGEYENINEALRDTWISDYVYTYDITINQAYEKVAESIISTNSSDMDIVQEVMHGNGVRDYKSAYKFYDVLRDTLGIDGFITEWKNENVDVYSKIAIAFDSKQFKNIDNQNPTENEDIRRSDRQTESIYNAVGELKRIQRENDKLKADIERLRKKNRLERTVTGGRELNESHIAAVAGHVLKMADSRYSKADFTSELKVIYEYLQGEDVTWDEFMSKATDVAQRIVAEAREHKVKDDYAMMILSTIRNARVSFNDTQKAEAEYAYGKNWNRNYFGRVTVANDGIPLESAWSEWASMYPDVFDADISDADMVTALLDIYDSTRTASEVVETYDKSEAARAIAFEIYNQFWNVSPVRTLADKHDKEVKRLKFEHRQEMKELRERKDAEVFETKWHYSKLIHEVREARDEKIAQLKKESREYTKQYREKVERRNQISQITKKSLKLNTWLKKNSKDEHIVEELKAPVAAVLKALDFSSERFLGTGVPTQKDISLKKAFAHLHDSLDEIYKRQGEENYTIDMPVDYVEFVKGIKNQVDGIVEKVGDNEYVLRDMTLEQLQDMNKMLSVLTHIVTSANKALADANGKAISSMAQSTMVYADDLGEKSKKVGAISDFFNFDNGLPVYVFKMFGEGGRHIFRNLQDGWDKMAFHVKQIIDYSKESYDAKEVKEWSKDVHEFTFSDGSNVKMTTAQIMSLYCLQKREQARLHLLRGGMRVADFKIGTNTISNEDGALMLPHEIDEVVSTLTDRQKQVADSLQKFMNTVCSEWGNEVSMKRFGIKSFGEENYFPIQSDASVLTGDDTPKTDRGSDVFRLLNMDFTKALNPHANNRIMVDNIFDVFATHTSDMAKYNALALPVLDMFRWYNYKESYRINPEDPEDTRMRAKSLKQSLKKAYGEGSTKYIMQFMKDLNGAHSGGMSNLEKVGRKMISNYKVAAVGANLRVALLQPTSYVRASAVMDPKYLTAALAHKPQIQKAKDTCGIALWKSLGFYDTNISRGVTALIKHDNGWYQKAKEISMKLAEWGDAMTWGYLYNACEAEIKATHPMLTGAAKDKAVADRLREVIYATQVVDSTMTRTQNMRNPSTMNQIMTSFMSEPSLSYNLLHDLYIQYNADKRQYGKGAAFKKNGKRIARVSASYLITLCCASLAGGFVDTLRDDEDDEEFVDALISNAVENALSDAISMLPLVKDVVSIYKGFNVGRMDMQGIQSSYYAFRKLYKAIMEGEWDYKTVYSLATSIGKAVSQNSGLPLSNLWREFTTIWNNTIGEMYESLKLK